MDQYKKLAKGKQCEMQWLLVTNCAVGRAVLCVFSLFALKQFIIWDVNCRYAVCWQELIHMPLQSLAQHITGSDVKSQICHKQASFVSRLSALMLADTNFKRSLGVESNSCICCPGTTLTFKCLCTHPSKPASFLTPTIVCRTHADTVYSMQSEEECQLMESPVLADKSLVHAMVNTNVNAGSLCQLPLLVLSPHC